VLAKAGFDRKWHPARHRAIPPPIGRRRKLSIRSWLDASEQTHPPSNRLITDTHCPRRAAGGASEGPDPERDKVVRWRCVDLRVEIARLLLGGGAREHVGRLWLY